MRITTVRIRVVERFEKGRSVVDGERSARAGVQTSLPSAGVMEQVHQHVVRLPGEVLTQQRNPAHNFGHFVHRYADEIDPARNGAIIRVVGIIESAAERERAVIGKTILDYTQSLSLSRAQHVKVI